MSTFLDQATQITLQLKNKFQFGFIILACLAFIYVSSGHNTPIMPQIFIFSVVPLIFAFGLVDKRWSERLQFVITLLITLMTLAFLTTGVLLSTYDQTPKFEDNFRKAIIDKQQKLSQKYLLDIKTEIDNAKNYNDYREVVLRIYNDDKSDQMKFDFDNIVNFYEIYIACRRKWQCSPSETLSSEIVDFWYTFRPIIEERRISFWGKEFALTIQQHAETIQPPIHRSAVEVDPATGKSSLVNPHPQT